MLKTYEKFKKYEEINERVYLDNLNINLQKMFKKLPKNYRKLPQFGKRIWNKVVKENKKGNHKCFIIQSADKGDMKNLGEYVVTSNVDEIGRIVIDLDLECTNIWIVEMIPQNKTYFSISILEEFAVELEESDYGESGHLLEDYYKRYSEQINRIIQNYQYEHIYIYLNHDGLSTVTFKENGKYIVLDTNSSHVYLRTTIEGGKDNIRPLNLANSFNQHIKNQESKS